MGLLSLTPRRDGGRTAIARFGRDFGLDLAESPLGREVRVAFQRLAGHAALSRDAATALLYRMFVQQALVRGEPTKGPDRAALFAALAEILERSEAYSAAAPDHLAFEAVASPMTAWITANLADATSLGHA